MLNLIDSYSGLKESRYSKLVLQVRCTQERYRDCIGNGLSAVVRVGDRNQRSMSKSLVQEPVWVSSAFGEHLNEAISINSGDEAELIGR